MSHQRIQIDGQTHKADWLMSSTRGQELLRESYLQHARPRCQCRDGGIEMYVTKRGSRYQLARMPGTGALHAPDCPAIGARDLTSGRDCYVSAAMRELDGGHLRVWLDPDLPRGNHLSALTHDGLLDLMIDLAGLNVYQPADTALRWPSVADRLREAASRLQLGATEETCHCLVPAQFDKDTHEAEVLTQRETLAMPDALVISQVKELRPSEHGWLLVLKHLPEFRFWVSRPVMQKLVERSCNTLHPERTTGYLCLLQVRPASREDAWNVSGLSFRRVDAQYLPCLSDMEAAVSNMLARQKRSFMRPLRYDAPWERVLADYVFPEDVPPSKGFVLSSTGCSTLDGAKRRLATSLARANPEEVFLLSPAG